MKSVVKFMKRIIRIVIDVWWNIDHYFNKTFHNFKVLNKVIITEMFNVNFHNKFTKFGLIVFASFLHSWVLQIIYCHPKTGSWRFIIIMLHHCIFITEGSPCGIVTSMLDHNIIESSNSSQATMLSFRLTHLGKVWTLLYSTG